MFFFNLKRYVLLVLNNMLIATIKTIICETTAKNKI